MVVNLFPTILSRQTAWLPNLPDLNPVDYSIWGALRQLVYRQKIKYKQSAQLQ